jgi:hypothetical protein
VYGENRDALAAAIDDSEFAGMVQPIVEPHQLSVESGQGAFEAEFSQ